MVRAPTLTLLVLAVAAFAAPVPKDRKEDFGPVTDKQLAESASNLRQIGLGLIMYHSNCKRLPNNAGRAAGQPTASWRVHLLPYVTDEGGALFKQYNFDEAWDSEGNKKLIDKMPKVYAPVRVKTKEKGLTFYRGFDGKDTLFEGGRVFRIPADFPDGTSNTVAVVEAGEPVVWTKPEDIKFDAKKGLPDLGGLFDGDFHAVFLDGHTAKATWKKMHSDQFKLMVTRSDGQAADEAAAFGK